MNSTQLNSHKNAHILLGSVTSELVNVN